MTNYIVISLLICLVVGVLTFLSSNNILISIIALMIFLIYFFSIGFFLYKKYLTKINRFHECYTFINTFIVSLSIKQSIKSSFETTLNVMSEDFHRDLKGIEDLNENEKLSYLCKYFRFHTYGLFLDLINLWIEQGGDILDMSTYLINESRLTEDYLNQIKSISIKKLVEFATLWIFTLIIMVVLRFSLGDFYIFLSNQIYFPFIILGFMGLVLLTIHIAFIKFTKIEIKGWYDGK